MFKKTLDFINWKRKRIMLRVRVRASYHDTKYFTVADKRLSRGEYSCRNPTGVTYPADRGCTLTCVRCTHLP
jgi:hypothetical protein